MFTPHGGITLGTSSYVHSLRELYSGRHFLCSTPSSFYTDLDHLRPDLHILVMSTAAFASVLYNHKVYNLL